MGRTWSTCCSTPVAAVIARRPSVFSGYDTGGRFLVGALRSFLRLEELQITLPSSINEQDLRPVWNLTQLRCLRLRRSHNPRFGLTLDSNVSRLARLQRLAVPCWHMESLRWGLSYLTGLTALEVPDNLLFLSSQDAYRNNSLLGCLTSLRLLNMRWCGHSEVPAGLSQLLQLRTLYLCNHEHYTSPLGACTTWHHLAPLSNLQELDVSTCRMREVPAVFAQLTALTSCRLQGNRIARGWDRLFPLLALQELDVTNNFMHEVPEVLLSGLPSLRCLRLFRGNKLSLNLSYAVLWPQRSLKSFAAMQQQRQQGRISQQVWQEYCQQVEAHKRWLITKLIIALVCTAMFALAWLLVPAFPHNLYPHWHLLAPTCPMYFFFPSTHTLDLLWFYGVYTFTVLKLGFV